MDFNRKERKQKKTHHEDTKATKIKRIISEPFVLFVASW